MEREIGTSEGRAGFFKQIGIYFARCWRGFVNDGGWKSFISVAIITLLICLVTGSELFVAYADTKNGAFALVCACIWIGIFNSIRVICRERDIVQREHRTGLRLDSYIIAHWLYEAVLCAVDALIVVLFVRIFNFDHFIESGVFGFPTIELYITFFLIVFGSDALGLLISAIVHNENTAMTVMPFALIIQLVMSGLIFKLEGITDLISYLTISRWGLDAICASARVNEMAEVAAGYAESMPELAATPENLLFLWGLLFAFAALYAIFAYIALAIANR